MCETILMMKLDTVTVILEPVGDGKEHSRDWYLGRLDLLMQLLRLADLYKNPAHWQEVLSAEAVRCVEEIKDDQ